MFKEEFKKLRIEAGLTQKQVAEKLEVGYRTVQHWEAGTRTPLNITAKSVLKALNNFKIKNKESKNDIC